MKRATVTAVSAIVASIATVPMFIGQASAAEVCTVETYDWNTTSWEAIGSWNPTLFTGLSIAAPAANESLTVTAATYRSYDRIVDETSSPNRAEQNEQHESFAVTVGGVTVGGLSADLPDTVAQGAESDYFSGVKSGNLGANSVAVPGGAITIQHSSLYGFTESANSLTPKQVTLTVQRCQSVVETTTTVAATTTTVAATTTTVTGSGGPTTTVAAPTTTIVASKGPVDGGLPATGADMTLPLMLAGLAAATGAVMLRVRRRPTS